VEIDALFTHDQKKLIQRILHIHLAALSLRRSLWCV